MLIPGLPVPAGDGAVLNDAILLLKCVLTCGGRVQAHQMYCLTGCVLHTVPPVVLPAVRAQDQSQSDTILDDLSCMLGCTRSSLHGAHGEEGFAAV